jgi:hypothetical protein
MEIENLATITTICTTLPTSPRCARREAVLGANKPASTLIVGGLSDPVWKVEVEGIAVAQSRGGLRQHIDTDWIGRNGSIQGKHAT